MKKIFVLLLVLAIQLKISGQSAAPNNESSAMEASIALGTLGIDNFRTTELNYNDIKGSPYLEKEVLSGYVMLIDNKKTEEIPLQYDIYRNEFFYTNKAGKELIIDLKLVREIYMMSGEENYLFKRVNPKKPHKFYEVIYETDGLDIYNEMGVNFFEGKEQGITKIDPRFSRDDTYYALKKGEDPKKIKLKKKDLFKLFSKEEQKQMDKIVKDQKIKLKKSKDFKQLFKSLNI